MDILLPTFLFVYIVYQHISNRLAIRNAKREVLGQLNKLLVQQRQANDMLNRREN